MAERHNFQPITTEEKYNQAVAYIIQKAGELVQKVLGANLPVDTVTIFSQTPEEYKFLESHSQSLGAISSFSHGATLYIESNLNLGENHIILLGVRRPDKTRPEVGYTDYPITNYDELKILNVGNPNIKEIKSGAGMHLLELKHPDFDVRGYIVNAKEHEK